MTYQGEANTQSMRDVFERYYIGWETKNPDLIASLHSEDTVFQLHDGTPPVQGRDALRARCAEMFKQFDFAFEMGRFFHGTDHWVFEWTMVLRLTDSAGVPFTAPVEMLDLVTIDADHLVTHKDV
ncbi:MAG: nuclear transport factor 2 family protein [Sphingomonadales bacterium]|nr:nuclear transport factor 2 family protein [Sphingomonadales bacterium]